MVRKGGYMRLIIAGGRDYKDYPKLVAEVTNIINNLNLTPEQNASIEIVSGAQESKDKKTGQSWGADYLGEKFAREVGYPTRRFPANWDKYGLKAGPVRNREMAQHGDILIAFHDGVSRGTKNMIDNMRKLNKDVYIIKY